MTIAGHTFDSNDICTGMTTTTVDGVTLTHLCGKRWLDLVHCDESCVQQHGYAHTSHLSQVEYSEIVRERTRRETLYEHATRGVSGGGDHVVAEPAPQPDTMACWKLGKVSHAEPCQADRMMSIIIELEQPNTEELCAWVEKEISDALLRYIQ